MNETIWNQIGKFATLINEKERATNAFESCLRLNPMNQVALLNLALLTNNVDMFLRLIQIDSNNGLYWSLLGHCHLKLDELQKAYNSFQQALYLFENPNNSYLWFGIGILYDRYGSLEHCEEAFQSVLQMDPEFDKQNEVYFRLGLVYKSQKKYDVAIDCFKYILVDPPAPFTEADLWFQIGHVEEFKMDFQGAIKCYDLCLSIDPNHAKVLQQLGYLYQLDGCLDLSKSLDLLKKSIDLDINDSQTWYLLGRCYFKMEKYVKAYDSYQQAVYRDGRNYTFWSSIGVLYYKINQFADALDAYTRALHLNPYSWQVYKVDLGMV